MRTVFLLLIVAAMTTACRKREPNTEAQDTPHTQSASVVQFRTAVADLRLRETPGEKGAILTTLPKDAVLEDLGEVSDFTTRVTLRGITYNEPWIKVKTTDGKTGWVYAGGINFSPEQSSKTTEILLQKRALALFGQSLLTRMRQHQRDFATIRTDKDFAQLYVQSQGLRDTLERILYDKIQINEPANLPDLFWISSLLPGFQPQVVAEGTAYALFFDYRRWLPLARRSTGVQDDLFVEVQISAFPQDSIEYYFPAWQIQTWDYGGSSLLGKGIHKNLLDKIAVQLKGGSLFEEPLTQMKNRIIEDITSAETSFWQPAAEAISELDAILAANYDMLTPNDKIALATRRKQLEDPRKHNLQVNLRAGG